MVDQLILLISVTALLLGSPGPAPLALAATGASVGVKRGLPFLVGILTGLLAAISGAAIGLSLVLELSPLAIKIVQLLGAAYIVYVAYKIASAPVLGGDSGDTSRIPNFADGFFLNLLNPKAYAAFFALFSQFALPAESPLLSLLYTGLVCFMVATLVDLLWLLLGGIIRPLFRQPRSARLVRICFAISMVLAIVWVFIQ